LQLQLKSALQPSGVRPIVCSKEKCNLPLALSDIENNLTSQSEWDSLLKLCVKDYLSKHGDKYRPCPTPDCLQTYEEKAVLDETEGIFHCSSCMRHYCVICGVAKQKQQDSSLAVPVDYHFGIVCDRYQKSQQADSDFEKFMEEYKGDKMNKKCPKCKQWTDKFPQTCNHATCVYCGCHFCWACSFIPDDWKSGQAVYAHMSKAHTTWYAQP